MEVLSDPETLEKNETEEHHIILGWFFEIKK